MAARSRSRLALVAGLLVAMLACQVDPEPAEVVTGEATAPPATTVPRATTATSGPTIGPATTTTSATTTARPGRSFTMAFTGDLLLHSRVNQLAAANAADDPDRAWDYRPMLELIRPWIEGADWAVCHLEVNLSSDGTRLSSYPNFRAPGQIAFDVAELGYDSCTAASNHILDQGRSGVVETLDVLDAAGLRHTGAARSEEEASSEGLVDVKGVAVAHLSYAYWFNGYRVPADAPWLANEIDEARILDDARLARAGGAEFVVVSLHWGEQYRHEPSASQRELGRRLLGSPDIDLIVGHHAHVVQPLADLDGEWLVYGLGNLLSNSSQPERRDELLVIAEVVETTPGDFATGLQVVPLHLVHATLVVHPTAPALRPTGSGAASLVAELAASWDRVRAVLATGDPPSGWPSSPG